MDSKKFYSIMANALLRKEGNEYGDIKHIAIENLKNGKVDTSLLDDSCITSRLILGELTVSDLPHEIEAKSATGQNDTTYYNEKNNRINEKIKNLKKCSAENFVNLLNENNDFITNSQLKNLLCETITNNPNQNLISSIFATSIMSKINAKSDANIEELKEFEYELEPIIKALVDNKKIDTRISLYDTNAKQTKSITDEVINIISGKTSRNEIDSFFHDLVTTYHMTQTITGKPTDWAVSLSADSENSMWYVSSDGGYSTLLPNNANFIKNASEITSLLVLGANDNLRGESGVFTAFKLLQAQISGKEINERGEIETRFANPDKQLQHLATMTFLCDGMCNGLNLDSQQLQNLQFAIMNPLTDIMDSLQIQKGSKHITEIINKAYQDARAILKKEQNIDYVKEGNTEAKAYEQAVLLKAVPSKAKPVATKKDEATLKKEAVVKCNRAYRKATKKLLIETLSLSDIYNKVGDMDVGENAKLVRAIKSIINYYLIKTKGLEKNVDSGELDKLSKKLSVRKTSTELKKQLDWLNEEETETAINTAKQILTDIAKLDDKDLSKETVDTLAPLSAKEILTDNIGKFAKKPDEESE